MSVSQYLILVAVFFVTSAVGVVTGSNSLITVPVMFEMGIEPKRAIATNMFGLTFMALGATIQFHRKGMIDTKGLTPLAILTLAGSAIGAALVGVVSSSWIPTIVSVSMVAVGLFTLLKSNTGLESKSAEVGRGRMLFTLLLGFLLAIYGGFYSGGYMTVLTAVLVAFAGMSFSEAIAGTKYLNLFSSSIATALFYVARFG